jgi:outer membrane protein TolC
VSCGLRLLLLAAALAATSARGANNALDLLALHQRAEQQAPQLRSAEAARAEQQAQLALASSRLGPQLALQWERAGGSGAPVPQQATLSLSQPLLQAEQGLAQSAQQQRLAARELDASQAAQQLRQQSATLYVLWHAQTQLLATQQQLAQAYAAEATRMQVRHREGLAAAVDWRQSQSFQWLAEANARGAAQQLRALRQQLVAHSGDAALLDAPLVPLAATALPPAPEAAGALGAPNIAALRREQAAREDELGAARRAGWPQLNLAALSQRDLQGPTGSTSRNSWQLELRLPLWDGGERAAGRAAAQARLATAAALLTQAEREQQRLLATALERLDAAREQHATAQGALDAAAQAVSAMRVGQEQGSRSTSDVLLALQTQTQLRQLTAQAQADAWLGWIEALAAQGRFDTAALMRLNHFLESR